MKNIDTIYLTERNDVNSDGSMICFDPSYVKYGKESWNSLTKLIKENDINTVMGSKNDINIISRLLWECGSLERYVLTDADEGFQIESINDRRTKLRWDMVANKAKEDDSIEQSGWVSSFTGEVFSEKEMDEFTENIYFKLRNFCNKSSKVLEIGIASGLTGFKIAPLVNTYIGVDLSEATLTRTGKALEKRGISNVKLVAGGGDSGR